MKNDSVSAVIVAAGRSERMTGVPKMWVPLIGATGRIRPLIAYSIAVFQSCTLINRIALVVNDDALEQARALVRDESFDKVSAVVCGGLRRQDSVLAGLEGLSVTDWVVIHDAARPLVTRDLIEWGFAHAQETGASCCALPVQDTVKKARDEGYVIRTLDRAQLWLAQTPQTFRYDVLLDAHRRAEGEATDDAQLVETLGIDVRLYRGSSKNIKVTTKDDLALVQALLRI